MAYHFEPFLDAFDQNGILHCDCGRRHQLTTRSVCLEEGALAKVPQALASDYGSGARLWILSDENTERAAGAGLKALLTGYSMAETILPAQPKPRTCLDLARELLFEALEAAPDVLLAVGSGTICDLGKKVSQESGIPNWSIATAPSVDAYTSTTVALKEENRHLSLPARPPERVFGDLEILAAAPHPLFLSGLGDLTAKIISYLDWHIAAWVTGEHLCPSTAQYVLLSARSALQAVGGDQKRITETLTDASFVSGLTIQSHGNSRPAASAEHTVAQFWEAGHGVRNESFNMHGMLVYFAGRIVHTVYKQFFSELKGSPVNIDRRLEALQAEPPWEETLDPAMNPCKKKILQETRGRSFQPEVVEKHLRRFEEHRADILALADRLLPELETGLQVLARTGLPTSPVAMQLDSDLVHLAFRYVKLLRNRYSSFDLMWELGVEPRYQQNARDFIDHLYRSGV